MMRALLLVDIQNDFLPGGALAVPRGDEVIPVAGQLMPLYEVVVATQDWHPADHGSFAGRHPGKRAFEQIVLNGLPQTLWPDHCVQGTLGAELSAALDAARITRVFRKGQDAGVDSYSGFFDNGRLRSTGMDEWLREQGVGAIDVMGLATDYCVKCTALDGVRLGFRVRLVVDGTRGVDSPPGSCQAAIDEMRRAGVTLIQSDEIIARPQTLSSATDPATRRRP